MEHINRDDTSELVPEALSPIPSDLIRNEPVADAPQLRELAAAIRRGEEAAFDRFYQLYGFRMYKYVFVLVSGHENEAREVLQSVLVKLARGVPDFEHEQQLWKWLCTLCKNAFLDHCRSLKRQQRHAALDEHIAETGEESDSLQQLSELLGEALTALTPEERELVQAAYVDRRALAELAAENRQSYKAMESRLARLRSRLKARLLTLLRHGN